jgi:ERCC4-type nuclease
MKIIIDERESALYDKCVTFLQTTQLTNIHLSKSMLPLGDILFHSDAGSLISIIERKCLADLLASIKDGRYEEQSHRLSHNGECSLHQVIYLIEGITSTLKNPIEKKLVYSAIASLNCFKGFSVLRSSSVQETAEMLVYMADKIDRKIDQLPLATSTGEVAPVNTDQNYCTVVKKTKKDNVTPENIGEIILCQIPSVNSTTAIAIMKRFESFRHLMGALQTNPNCLDDVTTDKSRKISKKCIENIRIYLVGNTT